MRISDWSSDVCSSDLPVTGGWGVAADCTRDGGLATVAFYKTPVDGFCMFVVPTAVGDPSAPGPAAWSGVQPLLQEGGAPSPVWLTVGFRVSDRRDVLDVRYHLDPQRLGLRPLQASEWALEPVLAAPERFAAVNRLTTWGSLAAGLVEDGFRGAMSEGATALPDPWERSEEHTSELQSLMRISYAVFCLKKKKTINNKRNKYTPNLTQNYHSSN